MNNKIICPKCGFTEFINDSNLTKLYCSNCCQTWEKSISERPLIHKTFMNIAKEIAIQSTCKKWKVGAVLAKDKRIISIGYNGVPSGQVHCNTYYSYEDMTEPHSEWSEMHEIHAEVNCIAYAARNSVSTEGTKMYITLSPCIHCAKLMVAAGIKQVFFAGTDRSDKRDDGIKFLEDNDISCTRLN